MPTRPTLSVPTPCHENWQTMTPAAQGRHCAACDKVVVDFTRMTDAEVLAFLGRSSGQTCGRFRPQQLNRPLVAPAPISDVMGRKRWMALAALLGLGATAASAQERTQHPPRPVQVPQTITLGVIAVQQPAVLPVPIPLRIHGVVIDSTTHEPLAGVTVVVADSRIGISTNAQGEFELLLPETFRQSTSIQLLVSYIGYEGQQLQLNPHTPMQQTIELAASTRTLGELVIVEGYQTQPWYTPRGFWYRLTRPFRAY